MNNEKIPWVLAQKTTFENWVNQCLKERNVKIENIKTDFKDGVVLYKLFQELTSKRIKEFDMKPKIKISCLQNLNLVIDSFKAQGVKIINVQGEDIYDETLKLILGFVWMLILHFQILGSEGNNRNGPKMLLLDFVNSLVGEPKAKNFKGDWQDGAILAKLVDAIQPGSFPEEVRPSDEAELIEKALTVADEKLQVTKIINAEFIHEAADELSLMTYTSLLKAKYEENLKTVAPENCLAYGPGLEDSVNTASPHQFIVELRNVYDQLCPLELEKHPLKDVDPKFEGPQPVQFNSQLREPGFYFFTYEAVRPGPYSVAISVPAGGPTIKDSPFSFNISGEPMKFGGSGLEDSTIPGEGQSLEILIDSATKSGGLLEDGEIEVAVTAPSGKLLELRSKDLADGKYEVSYAPTESGAHAVAIRCWGEEALRKDVAIRNQTRELSVELSGELAEKKSFPDNRATGLVVRVRDGAGEAVADAKVGVLVKDGQGRPAGEVQLSRRDNGVFEANVDGVEDEGTYAVDVVVDGEVKESLSVVCRRGTQAELVEGSFTFEVQARDRDGKAMTAGGEDWEVVVKGPDGAAVEVETTDHGDGRYSAKYHLAAAEGGPSTFAVSAKLDGRHVASSPFKHQLAPKPSIGQRLRNFFKR